MTRSHLLFPAILLLTLLVALLPAPWRLSWSNELAALVRFPLQPFTVAGHALSEWLRPPPSPADGVSLDDRGIEAVLVERERFERLYRDQQRRVLELEEELRQLQKIPAETLRSADMTVIAPVIAGNPALPRGIVEVRIPRRVAPFVDTRTVAVYGGAHLLGRVTEEPGHNSCWILPVTNPAESYTRYIRARLFPRDQPELPINLTELIQITPTGGGAFLADLDRHVVVNEGDEVRLDDPNWPATAQMMILGEVASVKVNDQEPLRNTLLIRPHYQLHQVLKVTLIIERAVEIAEAGRP